MNRRDFMKFSALGSLALLLPTSLLNAATNSNGVITPLNINAHKITDACLGCGECVSVCPEEAISDGDPIYLIDPQKCTDCGDCIGICPAEAIVG